MAGKRTANSTLADGYCIRLFLLWCKRIFADCVWEGHGWPESPQFADYVFLHLGFDFHKVKIFTFIFSSFHSWVQGNTSLVYSGSKIIRSISPNFTCISSLNKDTVHVLQRYLPSIEAEILESLKQPGKW